MEKIRQKRIPLMREVIKNRLERDIAMRPNTPREKSLIIFRKLVKEFENRNKEMKDLARFTRASSFKDLNAELSSLITLALRGSEANRRMAKIN